MPYVRKRRYPFRSRRPVRKYRRFVGPKRSRMYGRRVRRGRMLYRRPVDVQPSGIYVKLHFFDQYLLSLGGSTIASQTFRANSIFDPDQAGVGGTPSGYTEWAAMYNKYKVRGSRITVRFNALGNVNPQMVCCLRARSSADTAWATATNLQQAFGELRKDHKGTILANSSASLADNSQIRSVTMYRSTRRVVGRDVNDADLSADFGANPFTQFYYDMQICGTNASETSGQVSCSVWITYYVWLYQPAITASD